MVPISQIISYEEAFGFLQASFYLCFHNPPHNLSSSQNEPQYKATYDTESKHWDPLS